MNPVVSRTRSIVLGALVMSLGWLVVGAPPAHAASDWTTVTAGGNHTCGIRQGELYCWGQNNFGQLGFNSGGVSALTPTRITSATDWKTVGAGANHTCAIRSVGKLYCWGQNSFDQVGFNSAGANVTTPTRITSAEDWKTVTSGFEHTCAIRSLGKLYCWGYNIYDQVGFNSGGANVPTPTKITSADDWKIVTGALDHTCAIRSVGKLYCWGYNQYDQVGFNSGSANVPTPTKITSADDWKTVSGGGNHNCAIRSVGKLYCWGSNGSGQDGFDSGGANVTAPTQATSP
jgi:alpha-tubulin suppressor-like RCC1 family protein